jgi:predicted TIM-barrel fold metal-dependent hydrolase
MSQNTLPYRILDADNHFNEPRDCFEGYIDPSKKDLAIRWVTDPGGHEIQLCAGRPSKFSTAQITFSRAELEAMLGDVPSSSMDENTKTKGVVPGMLLNRLNPLKDLSDEERDDLVAELRGQFEACGSRDLRMALMDEQGIEAALMFPAQAHNIEYEFIDDIDALYANVRAFNRWMYEEVGFVVERRMFLPPYLPLADVDRSLQELDVLLEQGAPVIQIRAGHAHGGRDNPWGGRSPADPVFDPIWARVNEAGVQIAVHQGGTDYQKYGADWSEDPEESLGTFDAFQYVMYWSDRPAMELVAGLILHSFFERFPNVRFAFAEQGSVWVPYIVRKMDHAFLLGRKAKWGQISERPSRIFQRHFLVAPYPEENVQRVISAVGVDPIAFGSDFPHGEGLAFPAHYAHTQLSGLADGDVKRIMRDNLAGFLGIPA